MSKFHEHIMRGDRASQPAAASTPPGALYCVTDEGDIVERNKDDQSAWESFSPSVGIGDVVGPGASTDNGAVRFDGTTGKVVQNTAGPTFPDTGRISNVVDPSAAQDAATKAYVDAIAVNLGKRARVRAATTANIVIATGLNNGDSLDGLTLATGDLVLVKDQSAPEENGVYTVGVSPARASEFDTYDEHPGSLIAVQEGTANADTLWLCTSNAGGVLNTTAIAFSQLSVTAGINQLTGDVTAGPGSGSQAATIANGAVSPAKAATALKTRQLVIEIGDGVSVISTGAQKIYLTCPFSGTITGNRVLADASGSIVLDIWKDTYANFPPDVADTITAAAKPTLSSAQKSEDTTLTGWTTSVTAGDVFEVNVDSVATCKRVVLTLTITLS